MSRHRYVRPNRKKKLAVIVAAGALTVSSAAMATAAAWPGGSAVAADAKLSDFTQAQAALATQQSMRSIAQRAEKIAVAAAAQAAAKRKTARAAAQKATQAAAQQAAQKAAQQAAAAKAAQQAAQQAAKAAQQAAQQKAQQQLTAAENSGTPQQIAAAMLSQFGWSSDQMSCLEPLWQRESGWEVSAYNAGSGAFGIPQALPGTKMASAGADWQTSARTQIKWGLGYIQQVYGSPCGAWEHEEADGWY